MNRRTFEGPMEWEYQNQGPVDQSSPFAKLSRAGKQMPSFQSPSKYGNQRPNPFAVNASNNPPANQQPPLQPPHSSFFNPQIQSMYSAPPFRNPAFTTPQKRVEELAGSEMSGAESSPGMTDASEVPADTPDIDRSVDPRQITVTPATASRSLFAKSAARSHAPGRGELIRKKSDFHLRDKIRKRKRQAGDRDVGSVRPRLPHDSDDSDSDWEGDREGGKRSRSPKKKEARLGWFGSLLAAINNHPSVPAILSRWVQLAVNLILVGGFLWFIYGGISMMRSDLAHATEKARSVVVAEMAACAHEYAKNRCAPIADRLPALQAVCEEWEACMNQDPQSVMKIQVSARNVAEIINEFVGVMSLKAWGFILSALLVAIFANNIGFGRLRDGQLQQGLPHQPFPSQPAGLGPPMLTSPQHHGDPGQAYIWAPIGQTPRRIRRGLFDSPATDTDNSPDMKAITAGRRSPSKGDGRGRSPSKLTRSPSKEY